MKGIMVALLTAVIGFGLVGQCPVLPTPAKYAELSGSIVFRDTIVIDSSGIDVSIYDYLTNELSRNYHLSFKASGNNADVSFVPFKDNRKGYALIVDRQIQIGYSDQINCFYAVNTLLQLCSAQDDKLTVQRCRIEDKAKFEWRGLHLDVSRHFYRVDEVKRFIDLMALYKFNKFHWHLTDDQGWRIEINKYPELTAIGAFRDSTLVGHYSDQPFRYDGKGYGGYYTQEEIKDVVAYASARYIDVIPEIEMPGHSRAALAAYPELSCTGNELPVPGTWGVFEDIYCAKPQTVRFLQDVLSEVIQLFPYEYIHIGGDEAPKSRWENCAQCSRVMQQEGLANADELQSYFIRQMDEFLSGHDRKLIGWDEIMEGGLSPNAAVMSWRGEQGGIEAAKMGHKVVMSPTAYCYFDYYQSSNKNEPLAIGGYLPLHKVYLFDPVPKELAGTAFSENILGGQANLWTEYIEGMDHLEYMTFPRAIALAQTLWCTDKPVYEVFLQTYLTYHEKFLTDRGVNFSPSIHYPELAVTAYDKGIKVSLDAVDQNQVFHVHLHDSANAETSTHHELRGSDTLYFERTEVGTPKIIHLIVRSDKFNDSLIFPLKIGPSVGLPVDLITQPHRKYNHNGALNPVDGITGRRPWKGSEWLGFQSQEVVIIVDLLEKKQLSTLKIGFLKSEGQWIYLPQSMEIEVSGNKRRWKKIASMKINEENFSTIIGGEGRYVKFTLKTLEQIPEGSQGAGNIPWTFVDEIEIH